MTTYEISSNPSGVSIHLAGVGEQEQQLLAAFAECQQGRCSCPTDEYQKLETMDVAPGEGEISLQLRPKEGTSFDLGQITACLEYAVGQTTEAAPAEDERSTDGSAV